LGAVLQTVKFEESQGETQRQRRNIEEKHDHKRCNTAIRGETQSSEEKHNHQRRNTIIRGETQSRGEKLLFFTPATVRAILKF